MISHKERTAFIFDYLKSTESQVNVLNRDFVDAYTTFTGAPYREQPFGANTCRQLGKDLSVMYSSGILERSSTGLSGSECGFPKWVYVYSIKKI